MPKGNQPPPPQAPHPHSPPPTPPHGHKPPSSAATQVPHTIQRLNQRDAGSIHQTGNAKAAKKNPSGSDGDDGFFGKQQKKKKKAPDSDVEKPKLVTLPGR